MNTNTSSSTSKKRTNDKISNSSSKTDSKNKKIKLTPAVTPVVAPVVVDDSVDCDIIKVSTKRNIILENCFENLGITLTCTFCTDGRVISKIISEDEVNVPNSQFDPIPDYITDDEEEKEDDKSEDNLENEDGFDDEEDNSNEGFIDQVLDDDYWY